MKYRLKYKHNGKEIITTRTAETAFAAAEKLCDQYNWRCKLLQYDADTRGPHLGRSVRGHGRRL